MNFSKYAAALALFATAAYAAENEMAKKLVAARTTCLSDEGVKDVTDVDAKLKAFGECLKKEDPAFEQHAKVVLAATGTFDDAAAEAILKPKVETPPAEVSDKKPEGNWYDPVNNMYGYIGIPLGLILVGGGIYMAVGRKSADEL
jgi:hypothetical protein